MYFLKLKSELDIPFRGGYYFLDKTVENIIVNPDGECSIVDSNIQSEFINQFIPFVFSNYNKYDCINNSFNLFKYKNSTEYENKLFDYIKSNPNSYVGLWFLIESFSAKGYKKKYENILPFFSDKIKSEYLFPILQEKINNVEIKLDSKFPSLDFKNSYFNNGKLIFDSKYKYTLIDFWFSRCKPCLELYPELKRLYNEYHDKGFQVVSISVDKTAEIERWKNTIKSHNLEWDQYLDENGILSKENQIISFPTLCLLNEKGILISKNISLEELEGIKNILLENSKTSLF